MARTRWETSLDLSGPFFRGDPRKRFRQNVRAFMETVASQGEADVKTQMRQGESGRALISADVSPGRVSGHVVGRVGALSGKSWQVTAVVSVNNSGLSRRQGIALMAAASRVERQTGAFRRTTRRIRRLGRNAERTLLRGVA